MFDTQRNREAILLHTIPMQCPVCIFKFSFTGLKDNLSQETDWNGYFSVSGCLKLHLMLYTNYASNFGSTLWNRSPNTEQILNFASRVKVRSKWLSYSPEFRTPLNKMNFPVEILVKSTTINLNLDLIQQVNNFKAESSTQGNINRRDSLSAGAFGTPGRLHLKTSPLLSHLDLTLRRQLQTDGVCVEFFGQQKILQADHLLTMKHDARRLLFVRYW